MQIVPKICLNMIVKNENKIIVRLLKSVLRFIDYFVIIDTGSEDDTIQTIHDFFEENEIPGYIWRTQFENFEKTRNYALQKCYEYKENFDYILLMDADMELQIGDNVDITQLKKELTHDAYYLVQENDIITYKNFRLMKATVNYFYKGVTHEHITSSQYFSNHIISKDTLKINDIGNGGSKDDKYTRDIKLLKTALINEPKNVRYIFYLANSYRDVGQYEDAITYYKKRIHEGGWCQEIWQSYYNIGICYKNLDNMSEAINSWLEGFQYLPRRLEGIYQIIYYYRNQRKYLLAFQFYKMAQTYRNAILNEDDELFLIKDIYKYKLDFEASIIGYYLKIDNAGMNNLCLEILNKDPPTYISNSIFSNMKYYALNLSDYKCNGKLQLENLKQIGHTITKEHAYDFHNSTPSICLHNNKLYAVVRFVNYYINADGKYNSKDKNGNYNDLTSVETRNICNSFTIGCDKLIPDNEFEIQCNSQYDGYFKGIEDMRIFSFHNEIYFTGNRITKHQNLNIHIECGKINLHKNSTYSCLLNIPNKKRIEKNWVVFNSNDKLYVIYEWSPLTICEFDETLFDDELCIRDVTIYKKIKVCNLFKFIRGSTHGVEIGNEIWFIVHSVSYETKRYYYHMFVVLDKDNFNVKRFTKMFTFNKTRVEYTLGFIYKEDEKRFIIGYSANDDNPDYYYIQKDDVENIMFT